MPPTFQDQFIDDDEEEEVCPLCVEELDLTDKNFRPCPCGYQICQFCYNNIKTTMNGLCPACRRPYDDKSIQYKVVSPEEMAQHRLNTAQVQKRKAAARQKEIQKKEADHLSRKHLSGLRVRQKNLVYVTGLRPKATGDKLVEALRGKDYFGQYGDILKIVVAKTKDGPVAQNGIVGIYITFVRKIDAEMCIECVDMSRQEDGSRLRAQYGTTKYCSAYLRGETCTNKNCMFLHEAGDDNESFTRQDLSNLNASSTQEPAQGNTASDSPQPQAPPQQVQPVAAAVQDTEHAVHSPIENDGPALPAHASWADQARRESRTTSVSIESPQVASPLPIILKKSASKAMTENLETKSSSSKAKAKTSKKSKKIRYPYFEDLPKKAFDPKFSFNFQYPATFSEKDKWIVEHMPPLFDPNEGTRRRLIRERELEELQRQQLEAEADADADDEPILAAPLDMEETHTQAPGGSSQLGGEPEDIPERAFGQQNFLQQQAIGSSPLGADQGFNEEFSGLGSNRGGNQQQHVQQQQLLLQQLNKANVPANFTNQNAGHGRQPSRYFLNEALGTVSKNQAKQMNQAQYNAGSAQLPLGTNFNYTNVQGPPPGIKTSGTPPISGMFGQGHGFASSQGYGGRDNEKLWDMQRGRGNAGGPDSGKQLLKALDQIAIDPDLNIPGLGNEYPTLSQSLHPETERRATSILPPGLPIPPRHTQTNSETPVEPVPSSISITVPAIPSARAAEPPQSPQTVRSDGFTKSAAKQEAKDTDDATSSPVKNNATKTDHTSARASHSSSTKSKSSPKKVQTAIRTSLASESFAVVSSSVVSIVNEPTADIVDPISVKLGTTVSANASDAMPLSTATPSYADSLDKKSVPGTLTLNTSMSIERDVSTPTLASRPSRPSSTAPSLTSRPQTPLLEALNTPIRRAAHPRTIRITETPKSATPPILPADALPAISTQAGSKMSSRRPSLSSTNQPETPLSEMIDYSSLPSASKDVSRASSPPPIAGKKRGEKKPKKGKRVNTEPDVLETEVLKLAEEQSPIMGRKKKSKKPETMPSTMKRMESKTSRSTSPAPQAEKVDVPEVNMPASEPPVAATKPAAQAEPTSPPPQSKSKRLAENLFAVLGPELERLINSALTKSVSMTTHLKDIENPTGQKGRPFSHPDDIMEFFSTRDPFVLSPADHAKRTSGQGIRRSAPDGRIASRVIETPRGTRLRCLSEQEEDHLIALEDEICNMLGTGFWGGGSLEFALPGMPGYDQRQKQHAIYALDSLRPTGQPNSNTGTAEQPRDESVHVSSGTEDPARLINQFIFNQETEAITPMVPFSGEKAPVHHHHTHSLPHQPLPHSTAATHAVAIDQWPSQQASAESPSSPRIGALAARAIAARESTREVIEQVMGPPASDEAAQLAEAERRWQEERRYVDGLERRLNGVVKRNRKILSSAL